MSYMVHSKSYDNSFMFHGCFEGQTMNNQVASRETSTNEEPKKGWRKVLELAVDWLSYKNKHEWLERMRGNMSIVAIFIAISRAIF